jgi:uncharacterized protein (DUF58 family)
VAAMLAAILVSGVASAAVLRGLELGVLVPEHVFAKRATVGRIVLRNLRRYFPSFSVSVVPPKKQKDGTTWRWAAASLTGERPWFQWRGRRLQRVTIAESPAAVIEDSVFFPYIPPGSELKANVQLRFDRRGTYRQESLGLATRFPFAFLTKTRRIPLASEIVVYPSIEPADNFFEVLPLITGEFASFVRGRGYDLYRIREYTGEDSARHVDWKATAKSGSLKVREFSREDERKLRIVFDNPAGGVVSEQEYEDAVALAASLSWHFANADTDVSFVAQGHAVNPDVYGFLRYLALVQPESGPSVLEGLQVSDDYNIILTARARGSIPTALWSCSYLLFMGHGRQG